MNSNILFVIYYIQLYFMLFLEPKTVIVGWKGSLKIGDVFRGSGPLDHKKSSRPFLTNCHYTEKLSLLIPP
jgi:hypothetical protein